jgi:hypothetical protein
MLQSSFVKQELGWHHPVPWVVPAHEACHGMYLERRSAAIVARLQDYLAAPAVKREKIAKRLHQDGHYWLALVLHQRSSEESIRSHANHPRAGHVLNLLRCAAGVRSGRRYAWHLMGRDDHQLVLSRPELITALSNLEFSSGDLRKARLLLRRAKEGLSSRFLRQHDDLFGAYKRREAQLTYDKGAACDALTLARVSGDQFTERTSIFLSGWIDYVHGRNSAALDNFDALIHAPNLTWLYRADVLFAMAVIDCMSGLANEDTYRELTVAAYIFMILDLQPDSRRFLRAATSVDLPPLSPTDYLTMTPLFSRYPAERCFEMRSEAIRGGDRSPRLRRLFREMDLRKELFAGVTGIDE